MRVQHVLRLMTQFLFDGNSSKGLSGNTQQRTNGPLCLSLSITQRTRILAHHTTEPLNGIQTANKEGKRERNRHIHAHTHTKLQEKSAFATGEMYELCVDVFVVVVVLKL